MDSTAMHARIRSDLRAAMRDRDMKTVRALRRLLAAIDNAQAVPVEPVAFDPQQDVAGLGVGSTDVPRAALDTDQTAAVLRAEIAELTAAEDSYRTQGRREEAQAMAAEADLVTGYLPAGI